MEIALGCITTIFGSRAAQRIAILMNLYGLKLNQDKVLQASIFLKPKARMISLRYVSKYHKFCIEDSTEGELFFDVKKLMTRGDLTPILFGTKVTFLYKGGGDSMILLFRMGPDTASGRGLCDIDRIFFRVTKSRVKKLGRPGTVKIYRL